MANQKKKSSNPSSASSGKKRTNPASGKNNSKSRGRHSKNNGKHSKGNKSKTNTKAGKSASKQQESDLNFGMEVKLVVSFCVMILLMLSNFGLGGSAGKLFSSLLFGLFGFVQYVMPVMCFLAVAMLMVNDYSNSAMRKCITGFIMLVMVSSFVQLFYKKDISVLEILDVAMKDHLTGGLLGGSLTIVLKRWFGFPGAFLIILCIFVLAAIMFTQKSIVDFFVKSTNSVMNNAQKAIEDKKDSSKVKKTPQDKDREKRCEEKVKELEEKKKASEKNSEKEQPEDKEEKESQEAAGFHVPTFKPSDEVRRKDAVQELHPEIYPFTKEDGKTIPFDEALDYTAFSFNTDKTPEEFNQVLRDQVREEAERQRRQKEAADLRARGGVREIGSADSAVTDADPVLNVAQEEIPDEKDVVDVDDYEEIGEEIREPYTGGALADDIVIHQSNDKMTDHKVVADTPYTVKNCEGADYIFPPITLLKSGQNGQTDSESMLRSTAQKLQDTLRSFGVNVKITDISRGPAVTRYEMVPEQGTKVSKIVSLTDDIKLNLAAEDIRIEAPIPGKSALGIEVPNKNVSTVPLRDLLESGAFKNSKSKLAFAVGKDIGGQAVISDIAKMPHLLIAGATGSGKSVCINTLIMSVLYKARPDEVKLILIDPKMVELSIYNDIPHLQMKVVTDPKKAAGALNWAVAEMTERYNKFTTYGVRNLESYNERVKQVIATGEVDEKKLKPMPQILVVIDELADLMMVASSEVEDAIVRLSQLARAAGIHLVIATQRPSVNVITGLIKANVPSRIAFAVSSGVDSRTIIDMNGAEKLLGKGDMLFAPAGSSKPGRVQGAFVSDEEIASVVKFLKENETEEVHEERMQENKEMEKAISIQDSNQERDDYFEDAARFIIEKDKASIGMLQRMFKIGFNRAARIMDQLCDAGIVGPEEGTKPRKIMMSAEQLEQYFEEYL